MLTSFAQHLSVRVITFLHVAVVPLFELDYLQAAFPLILKKAGDVFYL